MESDEPSEQKTGSLTAAQRRAEIRRRKLLMNSEDRINRIVGFAKNDSDNNGTQSGAILVHLHRCRRNVWKRADCK